jgi:hypothetical protein
MTKTNEKTFEAYIGETLSGSGWEMAPDAGFDPENALFAEQALSFISTSQPGLWSDLERLNGALLPQMLIRELAKERASKGTIHILRHGFKFQGRKLKLAYFRPAHRMSPETQDLYRKNTFQACRQAHYHPDKNLSLDMVLAVNGIPVATIEIKNPATGQTWRDAIRQYKEDRDPSTQLSLVFDGEVDYPIGENTVNILFDTPFPYFGGNLVMMVNRPMDTQWYSIFNYFFCQTEGENRALIVYSDHVFLDPADPPAPNVSGLFPRTTYFFGSGTAADDPQAPAPATRLLGCRPNPFNPETAIAFSLKESSRVRISVYNLKGQLVATLLDAEKAAGQHSAAWDGRDDSGRPASSGMYLLRMSAGNYAGSLKMILLK